jgi:hypothetical protein
MILEAIDALDNENGSNKTAISGYIKRKYGSSLPSSHATLLTAHLARMKTTGELAFAGYYYFRPDEEEEPSEAAPVHLSSPCDKDPEPEDSVSEVPDGVPALAPVAADVYAVPAPAPIVATDADAAAEPAPPDAGAVPAPADADAAPAPAPIIAADADVVSAPAHMVTDAEPAPAPAVTADVGAIPVKRGRGRPPKPKELVAKEPVAVSVAVSSVDGDADGMSAPAPTVAADVAAVPIKRGRGCPPKPKDPVSEATVGVPDAAPIKRGRGRPPKPRDPVAEAVAVATRGMPRARGRPPKKAKVDKEQASIGSAVPATDGTADANAVPVKRGRGRPCTVRP